jgi:DNA mismatch endonuclease (patch repair protein)
MMAGISGKNSRPEMFVRSLLHAAGYRFRLHRKGLPGKPDIVLPKYKIVVFIHGCFWHRHAGCRLSKLPATRQDFWAEKLQANVERDKSATTKLEELGWRVLWVWECATRGAGAQKTLPAAIVDWMHGQERFGEISGKGH